jgi:transposase
LRVRQEIRENLDMALPLSDDLRERIIRFYENHDDYTQQELADEFGVSKSFIEKLLRRWRTTGSSAALPHAGGRTRTLQDHDQTVQQLVAAQPDMTLAELQARIAKKTRLQVSQPTLCRTLQRLRLRGKKGQTTRRAAAGSRNRAAS